MASNRILFRGIMAASISATALFFGCVRNPEVLAESSDPPEEIVMLDKSNYSKMVNVWERVAMVEFYRSSCGACRAMDSAVAHMNLRYRGKALVGKVNVGEEYALPEEFSILYVPTFLFFYEGLEVRRIVGVSPEDSLAAVMDSALLFLKIVSDK